MFKTFNMIALLLVLTFLFSGCVSRRHHFRPHYQQPIQQHDVNDIDVSDLDTNVPETKIVPKKNTKARRIAFPVHEYASLPRRGRGTIRGQIYVNDLYGTPVVGAGTRLYLNPITSYSKQWYYRSYLGGAKMEKADPRLFNYLRFTASNQSGHFAFYGVPNGAYYLIGTVKCAEECGYASTKSIRIAKRVSVHGNQIVQQDLVAKAK